MILEGTFTGLEGSGWSTALDYFGQDDGMAICRASCRQTRVCGLGYGGSGSRADTGMETSEGLESELVPSYLCCPVVSRLQEEGVEMPPCKWEQLQSPLTKAVCEDGEGIRVLAMWGEW